MQRTEAILNQQFTSFLNRARKKDRIPRIIFSGRIGKCKLNFQSLAIYGWRMKAIMFVLAVLAVTACTTPSKHMSEVSTPSAPSEVRTHTLLFQGALDHKLISRLCRGAELSVSFEIPTQSKTHKVFGCQKNRASQSAVMLSSDGYQIEVMWSSALDRQAQTLVRAIIQ